MKNVHRYCLNTHTSPKCYSVLSHPLLVKEIPLLTYVQCVVFLLALPLETACESRTCVGRLTNSWKPHMLWWVLVGRRRMDEVQLEGKCPKSYKLFYLHQIRLFHHLPRESGWNASAEEATVATVYLCSFLPVLPSFLHFFLMQWIQSYENQFESVKESFPVTLAF